MEFNLFWNKLRGHFLDCSLFGLTLVILVNWLIESKYCMVGYWKVWLGIGNSKACDDVKGFKVLPHRWIVERTFGWLECYRRLRKDYEGLT